MRPALCTQRTLAATAVLGMLLVGGCGTSDDGEDANPAPAGDSAAKHARGAGAEDEPALRQPSEDVDSMTAFDGVAEAGADLEREGLGGPLSTTAGGSSSVSDLLQGPAIISKGSVSAHADDVQQARFDTLEVMDKYGGSLAADESTTGDDGEMKTARMAIRVPSEDFEAAYADLQKVGDNVSAHSGSEDVTTEVIDVEARIRAQEQSLARIEALLAQAQRLRTVIAIESQLARRQAELDSLKSRQAYLEDQTGDATIIMHIERTPEKEQKPKEDEDDKGFVAGLSDGWDGLVAATVGIATVIGLLLPFAVVIALVGVPVLVLTRRLRAMRPASTDRSPLPSDG